MAERCINLSVAEARAWAAGATALIRPVHSRDGGHPDIYDMKWRDGDVLIGREAWCHAVDEDLHVDEQRAMYAIDEPDAVACDGDGFTMFNADGSERKPWRSAATMPAALARFRRPVVSVRVCRLGEVTAAEWRDADIAWPNSRITDWVSVTTTEAADVR